MNYACYLTRFGKLVHTTTDRCIGRSLREYGEWAPGETRLLSQLIRPGDIILDIGANIGFHTLFFSRMTGPAGRVHAFEPESHNRELLSVNKLINGLDNVTVHASLAGPVTEVVRHFRPVVDSENRGATYFERSEGDTELPLYQVALDDLRLKRCDLVKIDVEDQELLVIEGMRSLLQHQRPIVFFEQRSPLRFAEIMAVFRTYGYTCFWSVTQAFPAGNIYGNETDFFKGATETNVLAVPGEAVRDHPAIAGLQEVASDDYTPPELSGIAPDIPQQSYVTETLKEEVRLMNQLFRLSPQPL